jgi:hypothetical protein
MLLYLLIGSILCHFGFLGEIEILFNKPLADCGSQFSRFCDNQQGSYQSPINRNNQPNPFLNKTLVNGFSADGGFTPEDLASKQLPVQSRSAVTPELSEYRDETIKIAQKPGFGNETIGTETENDAQSFFLNNKHTLNLLEKNDPKVSQQSAEFYNCFKNTSKNEIAGNVYSYSQSNYSQGADYNLGRDHGVRDDNQPSSKANNPTKSRSSKK